MISAVISMFLDNVTTVLLMTPVVIKLFECLRLNPVPVLPFIILNINIAGLTTLIGHPPNLLITENTYVAEHNVNFVTYAMHMSIGVILALIQTNIHLRIQCRNIDKMVSFPETKDIELNDWHELIENGQKSETNEDIANIKFLAKKVESLHDLPDQKQKFVYSIYDKVSFPLSLELLKKSVRNDYMIF